jgi:AraC-like DNA-binding protein
MLISLRQLAVPELDVALFRLILRHPSFVVRLAEYQGSIVEDRLFEASALGTTTVPHWPVLALMLAGAGVVRDRRTNELVRERELVWVEDGGGFRARSSEQGARVLILQWDPRVFGGGGASGYVRQRLAVVEFERLRGAIERMRVAGYDASGCAAALADVFSMLHSLGLVDARPAAKDLVVPVPEGVVHVGAAIDRVLSNLRAGPASLDLERALGCSPAQVRRLIHRYGASLGAQHPFTWRDLRNAWRLPVGALLMTSARSRTEHVAQLLGYGSASAFCHAFATASLPSPGNVRQVVNQLE